VGWLFELCSGIPTACQESVECLIRLRKLCKACARAAAHMQVCMVLRPGSTAAGQHKNLSGVLLRGLAMAPTHSSSQSTNQFRITYLLFHPVSLFLASNGDDNNSTHQTSASSTGICEARN
jgi:hypothetical protein